MLIKRSIIFMVLFLSINSNNLHSMENNKDSLNRISPKYFWNTTTTFVSNHKKAFLITGTVIVSGIVGYKVFKLLGNKSYTTTSTLMYLQTPLPTANQNIHAHLQPPVNRRWRLEDIGSRDQN